MNKSPNVRRSRGRGAKRSKGNTVGNRGGEGYRVKGNPKQLLDKYKTLGRDALQSGDRVLAEYYFQHADHYQRILNERYGPPTTSYEEDGEDEGSDARQEARQRRSRSQRAAEADIADRPQPPVPEDARSRPSGDGPRQGAEDASGDGSESAAPKPRRRRARKPAEEDAAPAVAD